MYFVMNVTYEQKGIFGPFQFTARQGFTREASPSEASRHTRARAQDVLVYLARSPPRGNVVSIGLAGSFATGSTPGRAR